MMYKSLHVSLDTAVGLFSRGRVAGTKSVPSRFSYMLKSILQKISINLHFGWYWVYCVSVQGTVSASSGKKKKKESCHVKSQRKASRYFSLLLFIKSLTEI